MMVKRAGEKRWRRRRAGGGGGGGRGEKSG